MHVLTAQSTDKDYTKQRLILGTHTSDSEPNYLLVAEVHMPTEAAAVDIRKYDDQRGEAGGFGSIQEKIEIKCKILHEGEVNRLREASLARVCVPCARTC